MSFDEHWEKPTGRMKKRTAQTEGTSLDDIAMHLGALRRASTYLYNAGIIDQGSHARIMKNLFRYEHTLTRAYEQRRGAA